MCFIQTVLFHFYEFIVLGNFSFVSFCCSIGFIINMIICFQVLSDIISCKVSNQIQKSQQNFHDEFDPNIQADDLENTPFLSPSKTTHSHQTIKLCAKTVLAHLVTHLAHFPMAIGAARLSSLVSEHDDVPNICSDDLSSSIFSSPNIQVNTFWFQFLLTKISPPWSNHVKLNRHLNNFHNIPRFRNSNQKCESWEMHVFDHCIFSNRKTLCMFQNGK